MTVVRTMPNDKSCALEFRFRSYGIKMSYFSHTVIGLQCTHQVYGVNLKKQSLKSVNLAYNNSFRILHNLPSCYSASFMFVFNHIKSFNELIRSSMFLVCYAVYNILRTHFLWIIFIPTYILEVLCLNTGPHNCTIGLRLIASHFFFYCFKATVGHTYSFNCVSNLLNQFSCLQM